MCCRVEGNVANAVSGSDSAVHGSSQSIGKPVSNFKEVKIVPLFPGLEGGLELILVPSPQLGIQPPDSLPQHRDQQLPATGGEQFMLLTSVKPPVTELAPR